jgi:hypothetical protein
MKTKAPGIAKSDTATLAKVVDTLLQEIRSLIEEARHRAVTAANLSMVTLYWNIGRVLTQDIQRSPRRADYGERLLVKLAERLIREYGPGFSRANLQDMRRFHVVFDICQPGFASRRLANRHPPKFHSRRPWKRAVVSMLISRSTSTWAGRTTGYCWVSPTHDNAGSILNKPAPSVGPSANSSAK